MRLARRTVLRITLLTLCLVSASLAQSTYTVTDLGSFGGDSFGYGINVVGQVTGEADTALGANYAFLYSSGTMTNIGNGSTYVPSGSGINASGQVSATGLDATNDQSHAFLYSAGTWTDLGTLPGDNFSYGNGINDSGQVTGQSGVINGSYHAFLYSAGTMTDLGTLPGGNSSVGSGINASGEVTGSAYTVTDGFSHAFLYSAGTMTDLGTLPGANESFGAAINALGHIAGSSGAHPFLYSNGVMTDLGTLKSSDYGDFAYGINDFDQVVGYAGLSAGSVHAILYTPGQGIVDLNGLIPSGTGWVLEYAFSINNAGQITGYGNINGQLHAFLLTPTGLITPQENLCGCSSTDVAVISSTKGGVNVGAVGGNASEPQVALAQGTQADPVNTAFGSFFDGFTDIAVAGRGFPLSFAHAYSTVFAAINGPLGYGWQHSYNMSLAQNSAGVVTISQENGSRLTFNPASGGGYTAPPRVIATLVKNSDGTFTFTRRAQQFFTFSATGQLTAERDRNGYTTTLTYNSSGQLTTVTDQAGRTLTLTYSGSNLSSVADPDARTVSFTYDSSGNLSSVTDVNSGKTSFTYSPNHLLLTMTDPRGGVVTNTYDNANRVISQSDQLSRTTTFVYALGSTTTTDPAGHVTQELYNQFNQRTSLTRGYGTSSAATWTFTYDPNTQGIASITDPNGHVTSTTYDSSANPLTSTDGLSRVTTRTFDSANDLLTVTDPLKVTTTFTYDANGNLLTRSTPLTGTSKIQTYTYQYGDSTHPGDVTGIVDPNGKTTTFTYDTNGDLITRTDPLSHKTTLAYNSIGWLSSLTDARGKTTSYTRNNFGDVTLTTDPLSHKVTRAYDANRNLTSLTDADNRVTTYTYDLASEPTITTRADSTTLQNTYNGDGTVASTVDGLSHSTTYTYDSLARPISMSDPLSRTTSYTYDGAGNLLTLTNPSSQITTNTYDAADERLTTTYSDGKTPSVTLVYDADGQRTSMTDGTGTSTWTYDSLHRITSTATGAGAKLSYSYDLKNQLTAITYPTSTHKVTRAYDAAGRLTSITDWLNNKTTFAYDADANLTTETLPTASGVTSKLSYDAASRLTGITDAKGGTNLATFSYTRDANGQLTKVTETGVPVPGTDTYSYTKLNQLQKVNASSYSYDKADDITGIITPSQVTLKYDNANELTSLTAGTIVTTYGFDPRGNRVSATPPSGPALSYAYDQANRLTGFGASDTYTYNGEGLRMSKTVSATSEAFTWDRSGMMPLLIEDGTTSYINDPSGLPLEQISSTGTALFYLRDQLGSTRLVANTSGAVQASYTYDAYGNLLGQTGSLVNPFGYAGQYTDSESGLIYLRARYYDPSTAQFISRDPLVSLTREAYAYVYDSPLNGIDPNGTDPTFGGFLNALWKTAPWPSSQTAQQIQTGVTTAVVTAATNDSPIPLVPTDPSDITNSYTAGYQATTSIERTNLNAYDPTQSDPAVQALLSKIQNIDNMNISDAQKGVLLAKLNNCPKTKKILRRISKW
jgi:RHS repeat-associated protein